jgi:hypothetical protein
LVIAARIFDRFINKLSIKELNDALHGSKKGMIGYKFFKKKKIFLIFFFS